MFGMPARPVQWNHELRADYMHCAVSAKSKGESKVIGGKDDDKKVVIDRLAGVGTRLDRF